MQKIPFADKKAFEVMLKFVNKPASYFLDAKKFENCQLYAKDNSDTQTKIEVRENDCK